MRDSTLGTAPDQGRTLLGQRVLRGWELREQLSTLDPELYAHAPSPDRPYLEGVKGPCWRTGGDRGKGALHCLPYALLAGGFQCGAGSLFQALYKHPHIAKSDVSRWHFWAESDKTLGRYLEGLDKAAGRMLDSAARQARRQQTQAAAGTGAASLFEEQPEAQQLVAIDGSSSTFAFYWSPGIRAHRAFQASILPCLRNCTDSTRVDTKRGITPELSAKAREQCMDAVCYPRARQADRQVAANLGLAYHDMALPLLVSAVYGPRPPKVVLLLRDPVQRLYSAFWVYGHYQSKYGKSAEGFQAYVDEQLTVLEQCILHHGPDPRDCALGLESWGSREEKLFFHADQLLRGLYSLYLEVWLKFFDRKQFLIVQSEAYFRDPIGLFRRVLSFLELDEAAIRYHKRLAAADGTKAALEAPPDDKLWATINTTLLTARPDFLVARAEAARQVGSMQEAQQLEALAEGVNAAAARRERPPMPQAVRQRLSRFYAPFNQRLAELLGEPDFIKGWW